LIGDKRQQQKEILRLQHDLAIDGAAQFKSSFLFREMRKYQYNNALSMPRSIRYSRIVKVSTCETPAQQGDQAKYALLATADRDTATCGPRSTLQ
jgi:hypothetical protein